MVGQGSGPRDYTSPSPSLERAAYSGKHNYSFTASDGLGHFDTRLRKFHVYRSKSHITPSPLSPSMWAKGNISYTRAPAARAPALGAIDRFEVKIPQTPPLPIHQHQF